MVPAWEDLLGDLSAVQLVAWLVAVILVAVLVRRAWPGLVRMVRLIDALSRLPKFMEDTSSQLDVQTKQMDDLVESESQIFKLVRALHPDEFDEIERKLREEQLSREQRERRERNE